MSIGDSKPIGDLEQLQKSYIRNQLFDLIMAKSFMNLLPMEEYITTYIQIYGEDIENYKKTKKII